MMKHACRRRHAKQPASTAAEPKADVELLGAVLRGRESEVERCLQKGADASRQSDNGASPLMWAVAAGHAGVVRRLLAAGANTWAANVVGQSAMDIAQRRRQRTCAQLIEEHRQKGGDRWSARQRFTAV